MTINGPRDLEEGDEVTVRVADDTRGATYRVSDKEVVDIGITETFAVTLVSGSEHAPNLAIVGTTSDSQVTFEEVGGEREWPGFWKQVEYRHE